MPHAGEPRLTTGVLNEVYAERQRQDAKWGDQTWRENGTSKIFERECAIARWQCNTAEKDYGGASWRQILKEEVYEAFAEQDVVKLREELVQCAAVAVAWIEAIDRRTSNDRQD
jgi:hypothetical protein